MISKDQISGAIERIATVVATMAIAWLVQNGYLGSEDAAKLLPALVLLPVLAWGAWVNTARSLAMSAANDPKTVVVTTPEIAGSTPNHPNIVSNRANAASIKAAVTSSKRT